MRHLSLLLVLCLFLGSVLSQKCHTAGACDGDDWKYKQTSELAHIFDTFSEKEDGSVITTACCTGYSRGLAPQILDDPLGAFLAGKEGLDHINTVHAAVGAYSAPGDAGLEYNAYRHKYVDDQITKFLRSGGQQVIIFGAGLDTRAWRLGQPTGNFAGQNPCPECAEKGVSFVEVDFPRTFEVKMARVKRFEQAVASDAEMAKQSMVNRQRLKRAADMGKNRLTQIPLDLNSAENAWEKMLLASEAFDASKKTAFVIEGVSFFLTQESWDELWGKIMGVAAPGSRVIGDVHHMHVVKSSRPNLQNPHPEMERLTNWHTFMLDRYKADFQWGPSKMSQFKVAPGGEATRGIMKNLDLSTYEQHYQRLVARYGKKVVESYGEGYRSPEHFRATDMTDGTIRKGAWAQEYSKLAEYDGEPTNWMFVFEKMQDKDGTPPAPSRVRHVFLWKWHPNYSPERRTQVLKDMRKFFPGELLVGEMSLGENVVHELGWSTESDPKAAESQGFDCGLSILTEREDFKKWWEGEGHTAFGKIYNRPDDPFASDKINLEWYADA